MHHHTEPYVTPEDRINIEKHSLTSVATRMVYKQKGKVEERHVLRTEMEIKKTRDDKDRKHYAEENQTLLDLNINDCLETKGLHMILKKTKLNFHKTKVEIKV